MTSDPDPTARHATLPAFAPVPRAKPRSNGWKPEVQRAFIEALAETGSVRAACRRVGRADHGAYLLRRHPEAASFRAAWDAALDIGIRRIEDVAMERALYGVEVPVYSYGKLVGSRIVYNDRLVMFMLRNRAPERFSGGRPRALSATDKDRLRKLERQWRKQWEAEASAREAGHERARGEALLAETAAMHRRWFCALSPAARAAYRAFRAIEDADGRGWLAGEDAAAEFAAAEAEYERWFGPGADHRAPVARLVDMRVWDGKDQA